MQDERDKHACERLTFVISEFLLFCNVGDEVDLMQVLLDDGRLDITAYNFVAVHHALNNKHMRMAKLLASRPEVNNSDDEVLQDRLAHPDNLNFEWMVHAH